MRLCEDYRPKKWEHVIGQDRALAVLDRLRQRGLSGRAYFLAGPKGTGKTSIARLIAAEVADQHGICEVDDGAQVTGEILADISRDKQMRPFGKGVCWIINECHRLRGPAITRLLGLAENMPPWLTIVFTTTSEAKAGLFDEQLDASPLLERCEELPMGRRGMAELFAAQIVKVARAEGLLNGHPDEWYLPRALRIIKENRNSLRAGYVALENGELTTSEKGGGE